MEQKESQPPPGSSVGVPAQVRAQVTPPCSLDMQLSGQGGQSGLRDAQVSEDQLGPVEGRRTMPPGVTA